MTATADRPATSPHHAPDSRALDELLNVVERLAVEFATVSIGDLTSVVVNCRNDLSGVPAPALPELLERLARVRLASATGA
jgi:hypothetical protein